MRITNADDTWRSFTTTLNEVVLVRTGAVLFDTDATAGDREGIPLIAGTGRDSMAFDAGVTVYYKLFSGASARIARVATSVAPAP